jgi:hypothetical protein
MLSLLEHTLVSESPEVRVSKPLRVDLTVGLGEAKRQLLAGSVDPR